MEENNEDIVTIKYDPEGNMLWVRRFTTPQHRKERADSLALDSHNNLYVIGDVYSVMGGGPVETAILKYDPDGGELWSVVTHGGWRSTIFVPLESLYATKPAGDDIITRKYTLLFSVDELPPRTTTDYSEPSGSWNDTEVVITLSAVDDALTVGDETGIGVREIRTCVDMSCTATLSGAASATSSVCSGRFDLDRHGVGTFEIEVVARDGDLDWDGDQLSSTARASLTIVDDDPTAPEVSITYTGDNTDGDPGSWVVAVTDPESSPETV